MAVNKTEPNMKIIVDSREQKPYQFSFFEGASIESGCLSCGDYSLVGLADKVAIERKELSDLIQCLGKERERFTRELIRAKGLEFFAVVIESSWQELAQGEYRSAFNPHAACQSVLSFMTKYRIPFHFAGSRVAAEYCTYGLLRQYYEGERKRLETLIRAHSAA